MNTINLIGRIGQNPETQTVPSGNKVTKFTLATSEQWKDKEGNKQERTEWHSVEMWGAGGEVLAKYLGKGDGVAITGQLVYDKWTDKEGNNRTTAKIKARDFEFLPTRKGEGKPASTENASQEDDDLPF